MTDSPPGTDRYANLEALENVHNQLLEAFDKACTSGVACDPDSERAFVQANLVRIKEFIEKGARTGAVLHGLAERRPAQQMLDRWAATVFRAGIRDALLATLVPFDENAAPLLDEARRPYVGLEAFGEAQKDLFRGRDDRIAALVAAVYARTFVFVTGASGSGKSSLVLAGLIPALSGFVERGTDRWTILPTLVPGPTPLRKLADLLAATFSGLDASNVHRDLSADPKRLRLILDEHVAGTCLLVVDQFEEVFTLKSFQDNDSPAFVAALVALANSAGCRHRIVATFRRDREGDLSTNAELQKLYFDNQFLVSSMRPDQLRDAIVLPAAGADLIIEDDVVDALVNTFSGDETGLPLLQYCLVELWNRKKRNRVTARTLAELGDPKLAMAKVAKDIHDHLTKEDQEAAKHIFIALSQKVEGHEFMRVRRTRAELWAIVGNSATTDKVIKEFVDRRLLKLTRSATDLPEQDILEVAHEALLRNWEEFRQWVVQEGQTIDRRAYITQTAAKWADSEGKAGDTSQDATGLLLSGIALREAMANLYDQFPKGSIERRFLDASDAKATWVEGELTRKAELLQQEAEWQDAKIKLDRIKFAAAVVVLVAVAAWLTKELIDNYSDRTRKVAVAALETCESESDQSRRFALYALDRAKDSEPRRTADAVSAVYCLMGTSWKRITRTPIGNTVAYALAPDGRTIIGADGNGNIREQSTARARSAVSFELKADELSNRERLPVSVLAYSPDSQNVLVGMDGAGADRGISGYCSEGQVCGRLVLVARSAGSGKVLASGKGEAVTRAAFSRDGTHLAIASVYSTAGSQKTRLRIFDRDQVAREGNFDKPVKDWPDIGEAIARLGIGIGQTSFVYVTRSDRVVEAKRQDNGWVDVPLRHPQCQLPSTLSAGKSRRVLIQESRTCVFTGDDLDDILVDEGNLVYASLRGDKDDILVALVSRKNASAYLVVRDLARRQNSFVLRNAVENFAACAPDPARTEACENVDASIQASGDGRTIAIRSSPTEVLVHHVEDATDPMSQLRPYPGNVVFSADDKHFATLEPFDRKQPKSPRRYRVYDASPPADTASRVAPREVLPADVRVQTPGVLSAIDQTGRYFALQDETATLTTIWNADQPKAPVKTLEGVVVKRSYGGFMRIVRDEKGVATACELYRLASAGELVWSHVGEHVSCNISNDGQVAMIASADAERRVTVSVQSTAPGSSQYQLPSLPPEARYLLVGDDAKYVVVAEPAKPNAAGSLVTIHAWKNGKLARMGTFTTPADVQSFAARVFELDPARSRLVVTEGPAGAALRKLEDPRVQEPLSVSAFDPTGRYTVAGQRSRDDARGRAFLPNLDFDPGQAAVLIAQGRFALALQGKTAAVYDVATRSKFANIPFNVKRAEFSPKATHLVVVTDEGAWPLPLDVAHLRSMLVRGPKLDKLTKEDECRLDGGSDCR